MNFAIFSMLLTVSIVASSHGAVEPKSINLQENELYSVFDVDKEFEAWKAKYNVVYKSAKEEERRKRIWIATRKMVEEHQKKYGTGENSYQVALNHLADLEPHEYSCWPRKMSCRHRHRLVRALSSRKKRSATDGDDVTSKYDRTLEGDRQERQNDQDDDQRERDRISENNKDGRFGG